MRFNMGEGPSRDQVIAKYAEMASIFGADTSAITLEDAALKAVGEVEKLLGLLAVDSRLRNWSVSGRDIEVMTKNALLDPCHKNNPRTCNESDMASLYRAAY